MRRVKVEVKEWHIPAVYCIGGVLCRVVLGGWLHIEIVYPVTHPCINRPQRTVTTMIETEALPLSQTAAVA